MSIIVKGMKMPENCHECEFVDILPTCPCNKMADDDFWNNVSLAVEGHKDCPLTEIPEPHGKLIDVDALIKDLEQKSKELFRIDAVSPDDYFIKRQQAYNEALFKIWVETFVEYLKSRPIIIEWEE